MSENALRIYVSGPNAIIEYRHRTTDHTARLGIQYLERGVDSGVAFKDFSPDSDACIPAEALVEAMQAIGALPDPTVPSIAEVREREQSTPAPPIARRAVGLDRDRP